MKLILLMVLALFAVACGLGGPDDPGLDVIALIDGEPVMRADLDLYFQVNLLDPPEAETADGFPREEGLDRVKSRLFDTFMDEQALLAEARRRAIRVTDEEIAAYIDLGRAEGHGITDLTREARHRLARGRLLVQKLQEAIMSEIVPPSDDEVALYADQAEGLPTEGKHLLVRVLPFDNAETAQEVHSDIRSNRTTFSEAAQEHESQPGQASPQTINWARLPDPVRKVLKGLKPGQVSVPLDHNGLIYLFQVQAWLEDDAWFERERLRVAREQLILLNGFEATFSLMKELKESSAIQLQTEHLGFRYIPEQGI